MGMVDNSYQDGRGALGKEKELPLCEVKPLRMEMSISEILGEVVNVEGRVCAHDMERTWVPEGSIEIENRLINNASTK